MLRNSAGLAAGAAWLALVTPALADEAQSSATTLQSESPTDQARAMLVRQKFDSFDTLKPQGQTSDVPGTADTILQDVGGFRSWLADHGWYFRGQNSASLTGDVNGGVSPATPQEFDGQKATVTDTFEARVSKRIDQSGNDIGQLNLSMAYTRVTWDQLGPDKALNFYRLDYFQSFLDRTIEVDVGYGDNIVNYMGIFSGGNLLLANGLAATVPLEVGLSGGTASTPLVNVQINAKGGFYSKTGVQRSTSPQGAIADARIDDHGLALHVPGARALYIEEVGLMREASADSPQIWLRAGGIYNPTRYTRLDNRGTQDNWAIYALGDYQIIQPDKAMPYRGVFLGASAIIAPDAVNVFKQTWEARTYAVGMIPGRPGDMLNVTVDYNRFSSTGGQYYALTDGLVTHRYQLSAGLLYSYTVMHGVFLQPSATYIKNPSFTGAYKPAINLAVGLTFLL